MINVKNPKIDVVITSENYLLMDLETEWSLDFLHESGGFNRIFLGHFSVLKCLFVSSEESLYLKKADSCVRCCL